MHDTLAPKKRRANPITELEAEAEAPSSSGGQEAGGAIADQLQGLFGNKVVEAALGGGAAAEGIMSFASILRDATELNNLGISNAGPMGAVSASMAMDLGGQAREAAAGALKNGADQLTGGLQNAFGSALGGSGAGDFLSGFAMRSAKATPDFSQGQVAGNIKGSSSQSLPGTLATKLSLIMGMDMSKVRIHTDAAAAQASEALGAHAFALGSDVFFNSGAFRPGTPEGDALIMHELTHVMQHAQGQLPSAPQGSGITTSAPSDRAEVEATSMASSMASMLQLPVEQLEQQAQQIAPMLGQASQLLDGSAMRFWNPFSSGSSSSGGATSLSLSFNGLTITAPLPEGAEAGQTIQVTLPNSIEGVTFGSCSVTLDDQKQPASGSVSLTLQVGEFVGPKQATLSISAGGSVAAQISDCPLTLGTLASGSMNCRISTEGVTGAAVLQGSEFSLTHNFTSDGGQVAVELEGGEISGQGTLTGQVSNVGTMSLQARVSGDQLTGMADIEVTKGLQLVSGVTISNEGDSRLSGTYDHSAGCQVQGQVVTDVKDWMRGTVRGSMDTAAGQWNASGLVEQLQDVQLGNVTLSGGMLQVAVENGSAGPMEGAFNLTYQEFTGTLEGTYDPATDIAEGTATVSLSGEKALGAHATLTEAELTATIANSTFETATGSMSAKIKLNGQDTFEAALTNGTFTASSNEVSGQATVELLRDLQLPEGSSANVTILAGAMAEATIAANEIASIDTRIEWQAQDGAGMFADGDVQASVQGGAISGEGNLALTTNYGIPERSNEHRFVHQGAAMNVTAANNQLQTISLSAVAFTVENEGGGSFWGGSGGTIQGTVGGTYDLPTPDVTGTLTASVVNAWSIPVEFGEFSLQPGGSITGAINANELQTLDVDVPFQAATHSEPEVQLTGSVAGTFDVPAVQFSGQATATLAANVDIDLGGGRMLRLLPGSSVSMTIDANTATSVSLTSATAQYHNDQGAVAQGTVTGEMDLQAGTTTAQGSVSTMRDLELSSRGGRELEEWQVLMDQGSSFDLSVVENVPQQVSFDVSGHLKRGGERVANGQASGTITLGQETTSFDGQAQAQLITEVDWDEDARFYYKIGTQTNIAAQVASSAIQGAQGTFEVLAAEGGTNQIRALLQATYAPGAGLSGTANLEVLNDLKVWSGGGGLFSSGDELFAIAGESSATVTVEENALTHVVGGVTLRFDPAGDPLLRGVFQVDWDPRQENGSLDGSATITTLRDYELGQVSGTGITFTLDEGGSAEATFADTALQQFSGTLGVTVSRDGDFMAAQVSGTYDHTAGSVDGSGSATVTAEQDLGAVYAGGKAVLKEGAGATAEVAATELVRLSGTVPMRIDDDEAGQNFAEAELQGTYEHAPKDFSGTAQATINLEKSVGTAGDFEAFLLPDSGVSATVQTNELTEVTGSVAMRADNSEGPFAQAELSGSWTKDAGMNGTGSATLLVEEYEVANLGTFTVYVMQGAGAQMTVANNEVTTLSGSVPFQVRKGSSPFMEGTLSGTADLQNDQVSGSAEVSIVQEQQLATFRDTTFWVTAGSGISVNFANNQVTSIGGNLMLSLRQPDEFLQINLTDGNLDLTGATPQFSGAGQASVTREQIIYTSGEYQFAVTNETNATATMQANEITSITGTVGFRVYNGQGPLVRGAVEGNYDGTTGEVSGAGRAELEQRQDYGPIKVLPGTGGQATVRASQVQQVDGTIIAELHDSEGALVSVNAQGQFDAMTPELVRVQGSASLLRDLEPIPGVVISGVTGTALVEHNEIREVSGTGTITVEAIGLTGSFEANWANTGGTDEYWGRAEAGLAMDHNLDGHSARGVREVSISAELFRDGNFSIAGTAWYDITDRIGGSITIEQSGPEIDPVLSGTIDASGTLIEGRELFKWEKSLVSGMVMAGPIPISYGVDGAMGMNMKPVDYTASIGVSNFHILELNVPDFDAEMGLTGGAEFYAKVMPYVGVGVNFGDGMFTALGGLEGQAGIELDIDLGITGRLKGENDSYGGELAIGASLTPSATLALVPFAEWSILGFGDRYEFTAFSKTFDNLFELNWEKTYEFGDMGPSNRAGAETTASSSPGTNTQISQSPALADESVDPDLGVGTASSGRSGPEGGPQIAGDDQESGQQEGGQDTPSEIQEASRKAEILSRGVQGLIRIVGILGTNPVSAVVDVVLNFDEVQQAARDVIDCIGLVADMIRPLLPDWWQTLQEWLARGVNALADAAGMVLDAGRWLVNSASDALSAGWNWVSSWW